MIDYQLTINKGDAQVAFSGRSECPKGVLEEVHQLLTLHGKPTVKECAPKFAKGDRVIATCTSYGRTKGDRGTVVRADGDKHWMIRWDNWVQNPYTGRIRPISCHEDTFKLREVGRLGAIERGEPYVGAEVVVKRRGYGSEYGSVGTIVERRGSRLWEVNVYTQHSAPHGYRTLLLNEEFQVIS